MPSIITLVVWGGIAAMVVAVSIVGGIIASTINEGDHHKEKMTTMPPPPPPPGTRMRAMSEHEEIYGRGRNHFSLTKDEHKIFAALAHRSR